MYLDAVAVTGSGFGRSSGPHFLKDLLCVGTEDSLLECRRAEVRIHDCKHNAGVYCGCKFFIDIMHTYVTYVYISLQSEN